MTCPQPPVGFSLPPTRHDGCPECVLNVEEPRSVTRLTTGVRCSYICTDCGHAWLTDWKD